MLLLAAQFLYAGQVPVLHPEGTMHGFLVLRDLSGKSLAAGDLTQVVRGTSILSRLLFQFTDGSIDDETTIFSQRGTFRLISDHHIQKGPSFPQPLDSFIDVPAGIVRTRSEQKGKQQVQTERMNLPPELGNGMMLYFMKNMDSKTEIRAPMLVPTPKPRMVELVISKQDKEAFAIANVHHQATHFVMKLKLGGVTGIIAPLIGKQPADYNFWLLNGEAPAFIRMEGQLYNGGPIWAVEMSTPVWPKALPTHASAHPSR